ncbi:peptidoglycan/xylan/chitin deacetylase (PgdA/CDA1 family)/GT2 family glycosyltransferase/ubiquinone/menaquinone biosynthesis C-methylase UbiE [Rhizobium sp. BK529]|uniref:trifunctional glycosyltransferase/class I SAM-dependent methyltransferase/polysaccharide deacetylase n=1 Tax=unclassified Rhizobium TaxID=2613769 RepID=UPI001046A2FD|nr:MULTISPECIES: trifunctional glycosyltransferase/class I SAM-dependent methyltransferase/polysaccharide deacetylase [unclassified Rhizobium]MBB3595805.1 peptidoglycan/xylan/chitin deacetylase (PgdA/CDA1 family)/GT2 family glycosyltransferase/ubiquinone/menaquinone biosynthesis C-methylase UbiE [Rhizobium sp. BK529]TCR95170.1 polysaccharide deacetylase [Rhizobium sp. BK418]
MVTAASKPDISFLIPAYNAAETVADCLGSLQKQSVSNWQAVVVDDGSKDDTWNALEGFAKADSRILIHRQANAGAAAARNAAAGFATAPFLCMLDADDWLDPTFIECMLPIAADGPQPVIACCSYRRVTPDGRMLEIETPPNLAGDRAKREFSSFCALAIHTVVFPKDLLVRLGGMDTELQTCEDWDLWLRMAFAGAEFKQVDQCLAFYRMKAGSLSGDPFKMVRDAIRVTTRAQALGVEEKPSADDEDARWTAPALGQLRMLAWTASANLCTGADLAALAELLPEFPNASGYESFLGAVILHGLQTGLATANAADLIDLSERWKPAFLDIVQLLEQYSLPGTGRRLEEFVVWSISAADKSRSYSVGRLQVVAVDTGNLISVAKANGVDTLLLHVFSEGKHVGSYVGPLWGDLSVRAQLRLIIDELRAGDHVPTPLTFTYGCSWAAEAVRNTRVLGKIARQRRGRRRQLNQLSYAIRRNVLVKSAATEAGDNDARLLEVQSRHGRQFPGPVAERSGVSAETGDAQTVLPEPATKEEYWERVFERPDPWNYLSVYEQVKYDQTLSLVPEGVEKALELACAEGIFTARLAEKVGFLTATDISRRAIERASERCRACTNAEFRVLDFVGSELPPEQDLIVCSEVLYYMDDEKILEQVCRKIAAALKPGGRLITAHAHIRRDEPDRTGFDWNNPFGVGTIKEVLSNLPELVLEETIETELYAIHRFAKHTTAKPAAVRIEAYGAPLDADVAKHIIWGPAGVDRGAVWTNEVTTSVPVLMYHRIALDGPDALSRFRVAPEIFRKQMQFLRRQGYYTLTAQSLAALLRERKPIQGRPVVLTFDDAYLDFLTDAFPILAESGFGADVFVVTDKVGGSSDWDATYGEPAPLMSWADIRTLHRQGICFGSHLASHRPASSLDNATLLGEAALSRNALENQLGEAVTSIALPFGSIDFRVPSILAHTGYEIGFSTKPARASSADQVLSLPRLEVRGDLPLGAFAELMGQPDAFIG